MDERMDRMNALNAILIHEHDHKNKSCSNRSSFCFIYRVYPVNPLILFFPFIYSYSRVRIGIGFANEVVYRIEHLFRIGLGEVIAV